MGIIRYGRTAQIGVYPGNQSGRFISYRSRAGGGGSPLDPDAQIAWRFAEDKSLTDLVAGLTLNFSRNSTGTYVAANGKIATAAIDEPRFGHDPVTRQPLGLLIELGRTNLVLQSENLGSEWDIASGNINVDLDVTEAPDGNITADRLKNNNTSTATRFITQDGINIFSGTTYTFSMFVKADALSIIQMTFGIGPFGGAGYANFDIANGIAGDTGGTFKSSGIQDFGNGWYRCWITADATANSSTSSPILGMVPSLTSTRLEAFAGTVNEGVFLWGGQLEASAAFPSSYIPTTTTSEARQSDICDTTDVSWRDAAVGTYNAAVHWGPAQEQCTAVAIYGNTSNFDRIWTFDGVATRAQYFRFADQANMAQGTITPFALQRISTAYQLNDFAVSVDGDPVVTDIVGDPQTGQALTTLRIGRAPGGFEFANGHIAEFWYANVRKDNAFLEQSTAP